MVSSADSPHILLVSDHTYLPDRSGGRESSIHDLAVRLTKLGIAVTVVANRGPLRDLPKLLLKRATWRQDYRILRVRDEQKTALRILQDNPTYLAIYNVLRSADYATLSSDISRRQFFYIRDAEDSSLSTLPSELNIRFIANSNFIARHVKEKTGRNPFIYHPFIELSNYKTSTTRKYVTFINPVQVKGLDIAIDLASRCMEIDFLFIESWPLSSDQRAALEKRISQHPNIKFADRISDPRRIFLTTKALIIPSRWEEAFGRVALEAQISGIPVIASDIGGLPEAVGDGGLLIASNASIEAWVSALRQIVSDPSTYAELSAKATKNAETFYRQSQSRLPSLLAWLKEYD